MKFCINCGTQLEDNEIFCSNCGTKQDDNVENVENVVKEVDQVSQSPDPFVNQEAQGADPFANQAPQMADPFANQAPQMQPQMAAVQPKKEKKPKDPNKKSHKKAIILSCIAAVLVILIGVFAFLTFPLSAKAKTEDFTIKTNNLNKEFEIKSSQLVQNVYYSINPKDANNMSEYTKLDDFEGLFTVTAKLKNVPIAPGEGKIYFIIDGIFGNADPVCINYEYDLGYYAEVDPDYVSNLTDGIGIVSNRLIVKFNEKMSESDIKKIVEAHEGVLVGMNYYTHEAQVEFPNSNLDIKKEELKENDKVEDVNNEYVFKTELDPVDGLGDGESEDRKPVEQQPTMPEETTLPPTTEWTATQPPETTTTDNENQTTTAGETTTETATQDDETTVGETTTADETTTEETTVEETTTEETSEESTQGTTEPEEPTTQAEEVEDPYANYEVDWNVSLINANKVWKYTIDSAPVKVGVMDSFVDYSHPDLNIGAENMKLLNGQSASEFYKFFEKTDADHNCYGAQCEICAYLNHGTHVSGIIGSKVNNEMGADGICNNCNILFANEWTYSYEDGSFERYSSQYAFSYNLCSLVLSGAKVINYSVGAQITETDFDVNTYAVNYMNSTFEQLEEEGYDFVFVKAAGNGGLSAESDLFVAYLKAGECSSRHTLVVASIQNSVSPAGENGELCYNFSGFSNYGELVDVAAPGSSIYSTYSLDRYGYMSGTSMAAPHVTGVIALMYDANPNLTSEQVIDIVKNAASKYAVKSNILYPIIDAELCVKAAIQLVSSEDANVNANEQAYGFLSGYAVDGETSDFLSMTTLILANEDGKQYFTSTNEEGAYEIALVPGTYTLTAALDGYMYETISNIEVTLGTTTYNPTLNMVEESSENGIISGSVINAFDASKVEKTLLEFRQGINNTTGAIVYRCYTDESGEFEAELAPGNYTVEASVDGYQSNFFAITVIGGKTLYNQDGTLTPVLEDGEMRVVLTWGQQPYDLDSHLFGPSLDGETFHTFYTDMSEYYGSELVARLDVDDRESYGPETTSVYIPCEGTYVFSVYNYTNRDSDDSNALAMSNARVTLYTEDGTYTYYVPNREGTYWKVFAIENGQLKVLNQMGYSYEYDELGNY